MATMFASCFIALFLLHLAYGRQDPQQVHVSLSGANGMRISWGTQSHDAPSLVEYGIEPGKYIATANGESNKYTYLKIYKSPLLHHCVIGPLRPATTYYFRCSGTGQEFSFKTPPDRFPITFAVLGDPGQTKWTRKTLNKVNNNPYDIVLLPGDLAYADYLQFLWDSFGRMIQPLASSRPWMVTQGNHEIENLLFIEKPFIAYNSRWKMPFAESDSPSNLFYSFEVSGAHILMLGSYANFSRDSEQFAWLQGDLAKVDRNRTPWLIALMHVPWYNTNKAHKGEGDNMKDAMEEILYQAKVDLVLVGHVHAYERFNRVYKDKADACGPVHITVGDGGNREGLAKKFEDPQSPLSMFREASYGYGELYLANATHALWSWRRTTDINNSAADHVWLQNLHYSNCK